MATKTQKITIYRDGIWAGIGRLTSDDICDSPAVLGPTQDESDETYELILEAIDDGESSVIRSDGEYTWDIDNA